MIIQHQKLLQAMLTHKNKYITSRELANILGITSRTVKNYVSEINNSYGNEVILSSSHGYCILHEQARLLLEENCSCPDNYMGRAYYIIKKILIEHIEMNMFDLCEELFISYSTLKSDIRKYNITFKKYDVTFMSKSSNLIIAGSESSKRKLLSHVILQESNRAYIDLTRLKECFSPDTVDQVLAFIKDICLRYHFYISDYALMMLLQHLIIAIERIQANMHIEITPYTYHTASDTALRDEIAGMIEERFQIHLSQHEKEDLYTQIITNVRAESSMPNIAETAHIRTEILVMVYDLVQQMKDTYNIDLSADTFVIPFAAHLQSFLDRAATGHCMYNPIHENIRRECPLIYELAIFMTVQIQRKFNIAFIEDEIAYFALHIGSEMIRQNNYEQKIKCVLFCPDYLDQQKNYVKQLLFYYGNEVEILDVVSQTDSLNYFDFDLLLSTVPISFNKKPVFLLPPLLFNVSDWSLESTLKEIKRQHKLKTFADNFDYFFAQNLFLYDSNESIKDKEDAISALCRIMEENCYIENDFEQQVLRREAISPTAFGTLAVPHSMKMDAIRTGISILISPKGFLWNDTKVYLVFLPAISDLDKNLFSDFYSILLESFSREDFSFRAKNMHSFSKLKDFIREKIQLIP